VAPKPGQTRRAEAADGEEAEMMSPPINFHRISYKPRNVFLGDYKTTVRLEPVLWEALSDIADYRGISRQDLVREIDKSREYGVGLTSAIRVYIVKFYRDRIGDLLSPSDGGGRR
jgi:predicted DNA-binding ribbon-helix-helix protein